MNKFEYEYITDENGRMSAINTITGEIHNVNYVPVVEGSRIITPEEQAAYRKQKRLEEENRRRRSNNSELGKFYFVHIDEDFPDLTPQTAARLLYLNTFASFEEKGTNKLVKPDKKKTPIKRTDLDEILGLSKAAVSNFMGEVMPRYLIENEDGTISSNTDIFIKKYLKHKGAYTPLQKFYINGIQKIYLSTKSTQHRYLGYLFQMLPFINIEYNILCHNPEETNLNDIQPMTIKEFCENIGFDITHFNRLKNIYRKIRFEVDGESVRFCAFVYDGGEKEDMRIFVNPRVLYNGSDFKQVEILGAFCK